MQVLVEEHSLLSGATEGGQGRVQAERMPGTGVHTFIKVHGKMFLDKGQIGQFKPKEQGFSKLHGVVI